MKFRFIYLMALIITVLLLVGCSKSEQFLFQDSVQDDLYVGEYTSLDEIDAEMQIKKSGSTYEILIELDENEINATGVQENGTLIYDGKDKHGREINGKIDEYGEDNPVRVEININIDNFFYEMEFKRK